VIEINDLSLRYGPQLVFDHISVHLSTLDRIGLAGRNGAGKTTFLKALLGSVETDGGRISVGKDLSLGYLPQDGISGSGDPLIEEVEAAETSIRKLQAVLDESYSIVGKTAESDSDSEMISDAWETIHRVENELRLRESHKLRSRTEKILFGLGFRNEDLGRKTTEFSGGWQMRIALAKLLLQNPDYLLLDEPTNHLDLPSQRWLENFLLRYHGGLVLISHDRAFLDLLTQKTFALSRGKLEIYAGNYSYFEIQSKLRKEQLIARKATQDRQIEKTQQFINRFRAKATKATQVQSRIKQLDKVEQIQLESDEDSVFFRFPPSPRSNQVLVEIEGLKKAYGHIHLFDDFSLKIERGQRLAVVGANGTGKSTLAKILAGEESMDAGKRLVGEKTLMSYFAQHQTDMLDPEQSVLESALAVGASSQQMARDVLGSFLFSGDAVFKLVKVLSGGEKNRLALARMLLKPANLIILDEPTNHLDIQSKSILRDALKKFDGSFLIISHDREFLDPLVTQTLEINPKGHRMFWCNVSDYLEKTEGEQPSSSLRSLSESAQGNKSNQNPKVLRQIKAEQQKLISPLKKEVQKWEQKAISLEEEIVRWEERMKDPAFFSNRPGQKADLQAYEKSKRNLEHAMEQWEQTQKKLEKLETALKQN
jgi:ATP-binding cassette, subfamily F, member 3